MTPLKGETRYVNANVKFQNVDTAKNPEQQIALGLVELVEGLRASLRQIHTELEELKAKIK